MVRDIQSGLLLVTSNRLVPMELLIKHYIQLFKIPTKNIGETITFFFLLVYAILFSLV